MTSSVNHYDLVMCANNKSAVVIKRLVPNTMKKNFSKHKLLLIVLTG